MIKVLKVMSIGILGLLLLIAIIATVFINTSPEFGKDPSKEQQDHYVESGNFKEGKFFNTSESPMDINMGRMLKKMLEKAPNRQPSKNIEVVELSAETIRNKVDSVAYLTWFGHSAFLLEIDGKHILLDPMLGEVPAPHPLLGRKRYSKELPIEIEELPFVDAVVFSHDHYDHLDYGSVQKLKGKVGHYFVPLGLGNHLIAWGIPAEIITELYWWQEVDFDGIKLACTPSRHFSGRGMFNRGATLWCSWVIQSNDKRIFFSGDSGYDTHFKEIGEKYGTFDVAMMECGQYNEDWKYIHMMPEETAQAALDVRSKMTIPIHWGSFTLAFHDWTDPVVRVLKKAEELKLNMATPSIGQRVDLNREDLSFSQWWRAYSSVDGE
jgi:L-ascorbate metabolism protein UlaG (beta-lactamase superfamily)